MLFANTGLRTTCDRFLCGHTPLTQRDQLKQLALSPLLDMPIDRYGQGPAIQLLEQETAEILGKEAAVFVHKGVVAQQMALRTWAERTRRYTVALHPKSHIDADERNAYERLHPLIGLRVGSEHSMFTLQELKALHEPPGSITIELPLRNAGFTLLPWDELYAISTWAREQHIPLHFDGARLWECGPYYGRSYAEIASLADSVYVSFYKGLGGLAGCVLAGPKDFIEETQAWQTRLGGNIFTVFPYVLSAYEGLQHHLPKMASYVARAREIAAALSRIEGVQLVPDPPHINSFQLYLPAPAKALQKGIEHLAETEHIWLFGTLHETQFPSLTMVEVVVGEATEQWTTSEVVEALQKLLQLARDA